MEASSILWRYYFMANPVMLPSRAEGERLSTAVMYFFPAPQSARATGGRMLDPWHCVRAGCISQDIPGPTACTACLNWSDREGGEHV